MESPAGGIDDATIYRVVNALISPGAQIIAEIVSRSDPYVRELRYSFDALCRKSKGKGSSSCNGSNKGNDEIASESTAPYHGVKNYCGEFVWKRSASSSSEDRLSSFQH